ncbi:hypothetical protein TNCT_488861 [Trichonephila clavata]|uniref:Uncharacterized protein n=1 Tax=Trichonephila clavata TaxID=2740835 RepID=A0A8X6LT50_TRICU|nr:hypothetical protein TNCT_488861 [Trichonephila clavata]
MLEAETKTKPPPPLVINPTKPDTSFLPQTPLTRRLFKYFFPRNRNYFPAVTSTTTRNPLTCAPSKTFTINHNNEEGNRPRLYKAFVYSPS